MDVEQIEFMRLISPKIEEAARKQWPELFDPELWAETCLTWILLLGTSAWLCIG